MANRITNDDIQKMNELYLEVKTYAGVAKLMGCAPTTVKKYIIPNFVPISEVQIKKWSGDLPEFDYKIFRKKDWGSLCELSPEEEKEFQDFKKEVVL